MKYIVIVIISMLVFFQASASSQAAVVAPVHFVDAYYSGDFAKAQSIETDFTNEQGAEGYYYVSTTIGFGDGCVGQCIAYGGLQTNGLINGEWVGKMAIFSLWDAPDASPEPGVEKVRFTGEGVGYSLRIRYDWQPNTTYRFSFVFEDAQNASNSNLAAYIENLSSGQKTKFGTIMLPGPYASFEWLATFHERYSEDLATCAQDTPSVWRIENVTGNNGAITFSRSSSVQDTRLEAALCNDLIWQQDTDNGYRSIAGINRESLPAIATKVAPKSPKTMNRVVAATGGLTLIAVLLVLRKRTI